MINRTDSFRSASASSSSSVVSIGKGGAASRGDDSDPEQEAVSVKSQKVAEKVEIAPMSASFNPSAQNDYSISLFLKKMESVAEYCNKVVRYSEEADRLHRQVLTAVNVEESSRLTRTVEDLTDQINNISRSIRSTLKYTSEENKFLVATPGVVTSSDLRMRRTQHSKHTKRFIEVMKKFQEVQNLYKNKYKAQLERQYLIVHPSATKAELAKLAESDGASLSQQMFSMANKSLAKKQLDEMKERHLEIMSIEKSIQELHHMFLDLELMVDQQGELIDRVGEHIEESLEFTEKAVGQLESAIVKRQRAQKIKWIIISVCAVLIVILTIYVIVKLKLCRGPQEVIIRNAPS